MIPTHNGPFIHACAEKLGHELTKDQIISALDCLAHEAALDVEKWKNECKRQWKYLCEARTDAKSIQNISRDGGVKSLAKIIEENCRQGMLSSLNAEYEPNHTEHNDT